MPYESWIDRQIREAIERGEFDNLPGQGKPIKGLNGRDDENWWVKAYLEREQLPLPLPTALALRREVAALQETLADVADEESVREIVRDLNHRIAESHRIRVDGPPIVLATDPRPALADRDRPCQCGAGGSRLAPAASKRVSQAVQTLPTSELATPGSTPVLMSSSAMSVSLRLFC